jgi:hypothetical protein
VGDVILRQSFAWENRATYWARYIFDLTCFVIINLIFLNLLLGIIIDTFAGMCGSPSPARQEVEDRSQLCL